MIVPDALVEIGAEALASNELVDDKHAQSAIVLSAVLPELARWMMAEWVGRNRGDVAAFFKERFDLQVK